MADRVGQKFGNYILTHRLGAGGFAEVYQAEHIHLKTPAAIKILHAQLNSVETQKFLNEARTIANLEHPHIVRVLDFAIEDQTPFLVMQYVPGGSLGSLYPPGTRLPLKIIIPYVKQIASALQYVHDHKLIHRDVKPDNILLGPDNAALLTDFGISTIAHSTSSFTKQDVIGTFQYMAPEQFRGMPYPASDQYSLAILVYELLTGDLPFNGTFAELLNQHLHVLPPPLRAQIPDLTHAAEQVIMKALKKQPEERFPTVLDFALALEQADNPHLRAASNTPAQEPIILRASTELDTLATIQADDTLAEEECFLCHLDPKAPCAAKSLSGRVLSVRQRMLNGTRYANVVMTSSGTLVSILLEERYYQQTIKEMLSRGNDIRKLTLRVYHLPSGPVISEYKGRPLHEYTANTYTLAVLEPDLLFNITDLSNADYCSRQYLIRRLKSSPPSEATIRGNIIHYCFKELLKEHDPHKNQTVALEQVQRTPFDSLKAHLEEALERNRLDMALVGLSPTDARDSVEPHLRSLANWFQNQSATLWDMVSASARGRNKSVSTAQDSSHIRAETFLLAPEIGLRGRLDIFWQNSTHRRLLELKTGGKGTLPKSDHRWQVYGYHALLAVRREAKMSKAQALILYSGTPGEAYASEIRFSIREFQSVNAARNTLVLSHVTGTPSAPPGPSKCSRCFLQDQCQQLSSLLDWEPPAVDTTTRIPEVHAADIATPTELAIDEEEDDAGKLFTTTDDREFVSRYYQLLRLEEQTIEQELANLWKMSVEERIQDGNCIKLAGLAARKLTSQGEWEQTFRCENRSELRAGDEILLSDGDPIRGEVVTGTILKIRSDQVTVWTPELIDYPQLIDKYENDIVHARTVQNLTRWLHAYPRLRQLVYGKVRPRFTDRVVPERADFNEKQNLAVARALQAQDYLLIQGPPGTGKTSVIAEIVKRLTQQGQRVLLAAFTNQAVDNMLKRLEKEGVSNYIRLGHERSTDEKIAPHLLKNLIEEKFPTHSMSSTDPLDSYTEQADGKIIEYIYDLLHRSPVVASTTATWSSDKYRAVTYRANGTADNVGLWFDVAIIDEASQLTIPAIVGALRFVKRFILVGDDKQLPPLVLSEEAAEQGLSTSLFSALKEQNDEYRKHLKELNIEYEGTEDDACVSLSVQYRMNKFIGYFSSKVFYEGKLEPHSSNANQILAFKHLRGISQGLQPSYLSKVLEPRLPLVFLDVQSPTEQNRDKRSDAEAAAVHEIVRELLIRGLCPHEIGVIAPYRAQVANLRQHIFTDDVLNLCLRAKGSCTPREEQSEREESEYPIIVDTVDRFQGGEREVIIISFATPQTPEAGARYDFLTNPNRLNVALTRAKRKLILVGSAPALGPLKYFDRLLTYCRSMKTLIPAQEMITAD